MSDKKHYNKTIKQIQKVLLPYFDLDGLIKIPDEGITASFSIEFALVLSYQMDLHDKENANQFCPDDVIESRMIVENHNFMRFWGFIWWLETHHEYPINKSGKDPFYAEFRKEDEQVRLSKMCFGDYNKREIEEAWLLDAELDWVYEFNL